MPAVCITAVTWRDAVIRLQQQPVGMAKHSITQLHNRRRDDTHYMTTQKHVGVPSG